MRKRCGVAIAVVLTSLLGASGASAATEVGNDCTAGPLAPSDTFIQLAKVSGSLPLAVPAAGVVTRWAVNTGPIESLSQRLKVVRPTGNPNEFRAVGESAEQTLVTGSNVFATRIPVQAGDRFGLFGPKGVLICPKTNAGDAMGFAEGDLLNGSSSVFAPTPEFRVAVSAVVEPDGDGDGFGDETQDKCPQSAAFQAECPHIALEDFALTARSSVTLLVTTDHEAPVTVSAAIGGAMVRCKPHKHCPGRFSLSGGTQTVIPGKIVQFKLSFPSGLQSELRALSRKRSLRLTITATAKNLVGQLSSETTAVRLRGQAKSK